MRTFMKYKMIAAAMLSASAAHAVPVTTEFRVASHLGAIGVEEGEFLFRVTHDLDVATGVDGSYYGLNSMTYSGAGVSGQVFFENREITIRDFRIIVQENTITRNESISFHFISDPAGGDTLDDGMDYPSRNSGLPATINTDQLQISFSGGGANPSYLPNVDLPASFLFLEDAPLTGFSFFYLNTYTLQHNYRSATDPAFTLSETSSALQAAVPVPAAAPLLLAALGGLAALRRRG